MGTKTYFFEKMCFLLIQFNTFAFELSDVYMENHKQSIYAIDFLFSSETLLHKYL